jgi:hypothetical protein
MPALDVLDEKQRPKSLKEMLHRYSPRGGALIEHKPNAPSNVSPAATAASSNPAATASVESASTTMESCSSHGYVGCVACDPIEKTLLPRPRLDALTFGMLGCDFHCGYCRTG